MREYFNSQTIELFQLKDCYLRHRVCLYFLKTVRFDEDISIVRQIDKYEISTKI